MGGVLFNYNPARRLRYISEMCGIPISEVQVRVFDTQFDEKCELGTFNATESHAEFNRLCGTELSYDDFQSALLSAFEPNGIVFGIAKEISATCTVAGFTNNGFVTRDGLAKLHPDVSSIFADRLYCSAEFGVQKPEPEAFQGVLARLGRPSNNILFIDDMEENVRAALGLGFQIHRYFDAEILESDLRSFGLL